VAFVAKNRNRDVVGAPKQETRPGVQGINGPGQALLHVISVKRIWHFPYGFD
jgi:hypothetical protein